MLLKISFSESLLVVGFILAIISIPLYFFIRLVNNDFQLYYGERGVRYQPHSFRSKWLTSESYLAANMGVVLFVMLRNIPCCFPNIYYQIYYWGMACLLFLFFIGFLLIWWWAYRYSYGYIYTLDPIFQEIRVDGREERIIPVQDILCYYWLVIGQGKLFYVFCYIEIANQPPLLIGPYFNLGCIREFLRSKPCFYLSKNGPCRLANVEKYLLPYRTEAKPCQS